MADGPRCIADDRIGRHLRHAVGAIVALALLRQAQAAEVTSTQYSDAACTTPLTGGSTVTFKPTTLPCCYEVDTAGEVTDYLQYKCGASSYSGVMTKTTYSASDGDCTGTANGEVVLGTSEKDLVAGKCTEQTDGTYRKLSAPLTCASTTCTDDGSATWIPAYGYPDGNCANKLEDTPVVESNAAGNDCYVIRDSQGAYSDYVIKCNNGQYEQYRTTMLGCLGSKVEGSDVTDGSTQQKLLSGECTETQTAGVFAKSDSAVLAACATTPITTAKTTTTTEMPWGWPWWAWLLLCCFFTLCLAAIAGAALAGPMMQRRAVMPKQQQVIEETEYVVEDVVDEQPAPTAGSQYFTYLTPMSTSVPQATSPVYPTSTYYPSTY